MRRELLFSFVGHLVLIGLLAVFTGLRPSRPRSRPAVFSISIVSPGGMSAPAARSSGASVVTPRPKSEKPKTEPKPEPGPGEESVVRKHGLGARIEGADALGYSYYLNTILTRIADNWANPYQGGSTEYRATVYFVVEKDGTITGVKIEKGSGVGPYDASCERALLVTEKLPALPPEFSGERLKLHLEFEYVP